jgi:hypothetical protein
MGTTAAYATLDYGEFLRISSTHLQLPVPEYTTVWAASSLTPDKYTEFHVINSFTLIYNTLWHGKDDILLWSCIKQKIVFHRQLDLAGLLYTKKDQSAKSYIFSVLAL